VVGNLKYRSGSIGSWNLSEIPPIDPVRPIQKETQKETQKQHLKKRHKNNTLPNKTVVQGPKKNQIDAKYSVRCASWNQTAEE